MAFLAWLNGLQPHFVMLGGLQRQRPAGHLIRVFELAAAARALTEPELAASGWASCWPVRLMRVRRERRDRA